MRNTSCSAVTHRNDPSPEAARHLPTPRHDMLEHFKGSTPNDHDAQTPATIALFRIHDNAKVRCSTPSLSGWGV
jgi:hypothetical protein